MVKAMNVNYDYYRVFYYVAEFGNITQAADYLMYNQPNVTRTVRNLEKELGCVLFNRSNRGVSLTAAGQRLYAHIKIAVSHIEAAEGELESEKQLNSGNVFIGTTEIALQCFLLPILNQYRKRFPNIKINLTNYTTKQAVKALHDGIVDFSVVTSPTGDITGLKSTGLKAVNEIAVCGDYFKKLHNNVHSITQLNDYPLITLDKSTVTYEVYRELFYSNGIEFSPAIEAATADQILPMVKNNLGIGFIAEELVAQNGNGVYKIKIKEKLPKRSIVLIKKEKNNLSLAAEKLYNMIIENKNRALI